MTALFDLLDSMPLQTHYVKLDAQQDPHSFLSELPRQQFDQQQCFQPNIAHMVRKGIVI